MATPRGTLPAESPDRMTQPLLDEHEWRPLGELLASRRKVSTVSRARDVATVRLLFASRGSLTTAGPPESQVPLASDLRA